MLFSKSYGFEGPPGPKNNKNSKTKHHRKIFKFIVSEITVFFQDDVGFEVDYHEKKNICFTALKNLDTNFSIFSVMFKLIYKLILYIS